MEWISVNDRLPKCEEEVLIKVKHGQRYVTTTAIYEDGTMPTGKSKWNWEDIDFDYDEENDEYLIPKSWWEYRHYNPNDVYNNIIDGEVTYWMPLPKPPEVKE